MGKSNKGITLISLIVTIIIMLILAGVNIRSLTGDKGLINQAKQTKSAAEIQGLKEQIELAKVKAELKSNNVTMETVIQQLIKDGVITDESQVNKETGDITFGDSVLEGELAYYVVSPGEKYYGNKNIVPTNPSYFNFSVDTKTGTATLTGVKDEYAVKTCYNGEATKYTAVIKDGENYVTDVVIPYEYVDESGKKYMVTGIGANAFQLKFNQTWDSTISNIDKTFTSFVLPNTITTLEGAAFAYCTGLSSINIPNSVTSIGISMFSGCTNLSSINIPRSVTSIEGYMFYNCTSLSNVNIAASITRINDGLFRNCTSLKSVKLPDTITSILYGAFNGCTNLSGIEIPEGVTSIGEHAFQNCKSLTSVALPDSVNNIDSNAFNGCTNLESINIPDGITSIEDYAFANCPNLSCINIPEGVTSIGYRSFINCKSLTNIELPEGMTTIAGVAFYGCKGLKSINIPSSVTSIGGSAFGYCNGLDSIYIPKSVTTIGDLAFMEWNGNQTINCEILESEKPDTWYEHWDDLNQTYDGTSYNERQAQLNWGVSK